MKPFSCISRMPLSLVAPQTPAWVVCGRPSSRANANAGPSGNDSSPSTSKAIWKASMSSSERRRSKNAFTAGSAVHSQGAAWMLPYASTNRPGTACSASTAASAWSTLWRPWDQSTVVVTPDSRASQAETQVAGVDVLGTEQPAVLEVVPDEVLGERPVGAVRPHRRLPHVPVRVDHAGHHDAAGGVDLERAVGRGQAGADLGDPVVDDEHVAARHHRVRVVHGQHGPVAEQHGSTVGHRLRSCLGRLSV